MGEIFTRLESLRRDIVARARACGRDPAEIQLLAVSKTFPPARIEEAAGAGQALFGENRVQEAQAKIPQVTARDLEWHLIGHLQTNKVNRCLELFDVVQTLDSERLARKLAGSAGRLGRSVRVYLQINIGRESQKGGVDPEQIEGLLGLVDSLPELKLEGLMAIPPYDADPEKSRPYFRRMRDLLAQANRGRQERLEGLSMGMSHDYSVAVEEGATLLRVGTAIFGPRG